MNKVTSLLFLLLSIVLIQGCGSKPVIQASDGPPPQSVSQTEVERIPNPVPRFEKINPANQRPYTIFNKKYYPMPSSEGYVEQGIASWYGKKFHGRRTANGEVYDMYAMTAAHTRLPLPSYVQVRNLENDRTIILRVNDRGPFYDNRIIDLSYVAARKLGFAEQGIARVEVKAITPGSNINTQAETAEKGSIYVQLAAFYDQSNAQKMYADIQQKIQHPLRWQTSQTNQGILYRIQAGPLNSIQAAKNFIGELKQLGIRGSKVLP